MDRQVDLLIRSKQVREVPHHVRYSEQHCLDVIDLMTRVTIQVRANEVSPYLHTLMMNGTPYEILSIYKPRN